MLKGEVPVLLMVSAPPSAMETAPRSTSISGCAESTQANRQGSSRARQRTEILKGARLWRRIRAGQQPLSRRLDGHVKQLAFAGADQHGAVGADHARAGHEIFLALQLVLERQLTQHLSRARVPDHQLFLVVEGGAAAAVGAEAHAADPLGESFELAGRLFLELPG